MTVLNAAAAVYVGGVAAVAVYAGAVKVWPEAPTEPPPYPVVNAQDDGLRMMIWDARSADLRGGPYVIHVVTTELFRSQSQQTPTGNAFWVDYENTVLTVVSSNGSPMTYAGTVAASARPWAILTWDGVNARWVLTW